VSSNNLTYIGHATTLLRLDGAAILTDPLLRDRFGPLRRQAPTLPADLPGHVDVVLISHLHRDHLDLPSLRRLPPDTPVVVPRGSTRWMSGIEANRIREIGRGETISISGKKVTAVPALHGGRRGRWGAGIDPLGYVIDGGGYTVYFAGDTDLFPQMSELGPLDLALLPVWGWGTSVGPGHLDPESAAQALQLLRPRLAVPIHWGTLYPIGLRRLRPKPLSDPPLEFARLAQEVAPEVEVRVIPPGGETTLGSP
jgi:L-ascorbate metabolism protein UlaG (beta-lactamase superfamily)